MASAYHRRFFIAGPAGQLEALLWTPVRPDPPMVALVCHPHPLFGGTMHNKVVFRVARTLHNLGMAVLRFNFRGTGLSEGVHDKGRGEQDDVRAALDWLAGEFPEKPILLAGFSFGSLVGLNVGQGDERVQGLVALGLPIQRAEAGFLRDCRKPRLFLIGADDQLSDVEKLKEFFAGLPEPKRLIVVPDVDHFFTGKLDEVGRALRDWLAEFYPELADSSQGTADSSPLRSPE